MEMPSVIFQGYGGIDLALRDLNLKVEGQGSVEGPFHEFVKGMTEAQRLDAAMEFLRMALDMNERAGAGYIDRDMGTDIVGRGGAEHHLKEWRISLLGRESRRVWQGW